VRQFLKQTIRDISQNKDKKKSKVVLSMYSHRKVCALFKIFKVYEKLNVYGS